MSAYRVFKNLALLLVAAAASGCIVPMSRPPTVLLAGESKPMSVRAVAVEGTRKGVIYAGMTRGEIHRILAGLPVTNSPAKDGLSEQERFGPFVKKIPHLYIAAWHGSHSWGLHPVQCSFAICVNYKDDIAQECWCSELWWP